MALSSPATSTKRCFILFASKCFAFDLAKLNRLAPPTEPKDFRNSGEGYTKKASSNTQGIRLTNKLVHTEGLWNAETASLVYDPGDAGAEWKGFFHRIFGQPTIGMAAGRVAKVFLKIRQHGFHNCRVAWGSGIIVKIELGVHGCLLEFTIKIRTFFD